MKVSPPSSSRFLLLTKHLRLKVTMLLLAFFCWFLVRTERTIEVEFNFPLVLDYGAVQGMLPIEEPPEEILVRLRGKGRSLLYFALFQSGEYRLSLEGSERHNTSSKHIALKSSRDFAVISIHPTVLHIELDSLKSRRLPIVYDGQFKVLDGYMQSGEIQLYPSLVGVTGPKRLLDTLHVIHTEWTRMDRVKRDVEKRLSLISPASSLQLVRKEVTLKVQIDKLVSRTFNDLPVQLLNFPDSLTVFPALCSAELFGGARQLEALDPEVLKAILDFDFYQDSLFCVACSLDIPKGFDLLKLEPICFPLELVLPDTLQTDSLDAESAWLFQ